MLGIWQILQMYSTLEAAGEFSHVGSWRSSSNPCDLAYMAVATQFRTRLRSSAQELHFMRVRTPSPTSKELSFASCCWQQDVRRTLFDLLTARCKDCLRVRANGIWFSLFCMFVVCLCPTAVGLVPGTEFPERLLLESFASMATHQYPATGWLDKRCIDPVSLAPQPMSPASVN